MSKLVRFELEGNESILVEVEEETGGLAPIGDASGVVGQAPHKFEESFAALKPLADGIIAKLKTAAHPPDEVKIDLELKLTGKGNLVIASSEGCASFKVSLVWRNTKS